MSGQQIANEVLAALQEAGTETGDGPLVAQLTAVEVGGTPWTGTSFPPEPVDVTIVIDQFWRDEIDGTQVRAGDKKVLMDATGPVPKTGDTLTISGHAHRIEGVMPLAPAGVAVMYEVQARESGGA